MTLRSHNPPLDVDDPKRFGRFNPKIGVSVWTIQPQASPLVTPPQPLTAELEKQAPSPSIRPRTHFAGLDPSLEPPSETTNGVYSSWFPLPCYGPRPNIRIHTAVAP
jgi:hypothetical protein